MEKVTDRKIILVTRKTRLENLIVQYNTIQQAKFIIEHSGSDFSDYVNEDKQYKSTVSQTISILEAFGYVQVLDRDYISNFIFGKEDIIVVVGQDGLVANTLKYLDNQPLIGVNPDPKRWDGVLLPFNVKELEKVMIDVFKSHRIIKEVTLAKVSLNDGQSLLAVNDLFIGQKTHVSARYILQYNGEQEHQSSSGIIISTGLGSTGWFKSILAGATGVAGNCLNKPLQLRQIDDFSWDSDFLYYTVREPYPSNWTSANMVFGKISKRNTFKIESLMPENGVIFSDGIESDYLQFNSGTEAIISIADHKGLLVV